MVVPVYGLVFYPKPEAPAAERTQGRLLSLHLSAESAIAFYQSNRDSLLKTYSDPAVWNDKHGIPLAPITATACIGTAFDVPQLQKEIGNALRSNAPCLMMRYDPKTNYVLRNNEFDKIIANARTEFFALPQPSPTHPDQKKPVGKRKKPSL